jgi:hypothetical protein
VVLVLGGVVFVSSALLFNLGGYATLECTVKEGNLISFKLLLDRGGVVVTELSGVPEKELHKIFKGDDLQLMRTLIRICNEKLQPLHNHIENELDALNHSSMG